MELDLPGKFESSLAHLLTSLISWQLHYSTADRIVQEKRRQISCLVDENRKY